MPKNVLKFHQVLRCVYLLLAVAILPSASPAQSPDAKPAVPSPPATSVFVTLKGNVHPLANAQNDLGVAPDSLPMNRMLLLLQRDSVKEAALQKLLQDQQVKGSPSYRNWLTPQAFGQQFGASDETLAAAKDWLSSQGFQVTRTTMGRNIIEFSGTAGQVKSAFHTEIHKYQVQGADYWANQSNPQIPAALVPMVQGIVSLHNFPTPAEMRRAASAAKSSSGSGKPGPRPNFTFPGDDCTSIGTCFAVTPADFATIYDLAPLYAAGIDGTGQSIAVVSGSNIHLSDVQHFRALFNLPVNDPTITVVGSDPGIVPGDEFETNFSVQWAGAVAKNANIQLIVSQSTTTSRGIDLAAIYAVDNNVAPILTENLNVCEDALGSSGTTFYISLWEQAAAEGITVVVPTGDTGSAACDSPLTEAAATHGIAINGVASTAFNVAVGGTDFNQVGNWSTFWNTSNDANNASAKSYIPETTWNDTCTENGINGCDNVSSSGSDLIAGGGGLSKYTQTPPWQAVGSFSLAGSRGIPDVSMFAGDGNNGSFYVICEEDAQQGGPGCDLNAPFLDFASIGGTTGAASTFAGIMALVNQQTNARQGNANLVIYRLAAGPAAGSVFHDVSLGSNSVACVAGSPFCSNTSSSGFGFLGDSSNALWSAFTGYDVATGWGSVDANNFVTQWSSITFQQTTTALVSFSPTTLTHGQAANFQITVTAPGGGTPTGDVALIVTPASGTPFAADFFTLQNGAFSGSTTFLPGGTYQISAHYAGDSTFAPSDSGPITITVGAQASQTVLSIISNNGGNTTCQTSDLGFFYGDPYVIFGIVNTSGDPCLGINSSTLPTGTVTLTDLGNPLDAGTYQLNTRANFEDRAASLSPGEHIITAQYSGDKSYNPSTTASPLVININQGQTSLTLTANATTVLAGTNVTITATVNTSSVAAAPSGTVLFTANGMQLGKGTLVPASAANGFVQGVATFTFAPQNTITITAQYNGDQNYAAPISQTITIMSGNPDFSLSLTSTNLVVTAGQSAMAPITVTPLLGFTGAVTFATPAAASLPPGITVSVNPSPVTLAADGKPVVTTLTVTSIAPTAVANVSSSLIDIPGPALFQARIVAVAFTVFPLGFLFVRRRRRDFFLLSLVLVVLLVASCSTVNHHTSISAGSVLTLGSSSVKSAQGTPVTLRAFISADHSIGGTVDFLDNGVSIAQGLEVSVGRASFTTSTLSVGVHTITATYSGDSRTNAASSAAPFFQAITGQFTFQITATAPGATSSHPLTVNATLQ